MINVYDVFPTEDENFEYWSKGSVAGAVFPWTFVINDLIVTYTSVLYLDYMKMFCDLADF